MSSVNEWIVREFFETRGFLVCQPCKYSAPGHSKAEEEAELLLSNPTVQEHRIPDHLVWTAEDVRSVGRAVVSVWGWHTDRFSPAFFDSNPEIFRFTAEDSVRLFSRRLGTKDVARILCLSQFPASENLRNNALAILKEKGVDGVLLFRTMLLYLIQTVEANRNYEKSDLLQMLRLLKHYDLLKDNQLELFQRKRKKKASSPPANPPPAPG